MFGYTNRYKLLRRTESKNTSYKEKFTEEIQNLYEKHIIKIEYDILLEGTETHLFMQNPKPIKPFKTLQHLDPYVME